MCDVSVVRLVLNSQGLSQYSLGDNSMASLLCGRITVLSFYGI